MFDISHTHAATVEIRPSVSKADPAAVFAALASRPDVCWLESTAADDRLGRYTIAACRPLVVATLRDGVLTGPTGPTGPDNSGEPPTHGPALPPVWWPSGCGESLTDALRRLLSCVRASLPTDCAYGPGWMGYLGYELGRHFERLPGQAVRDTALPDMHLAFYDAVAVFDRQSGRWQLACLRFDDPPEGAGRAEHDLLAAFAEAESIRPPSAAVLAAADLAACVADSGLTSTFTPDAYRAAVARCIEYIAAGDIFQVNLSQRLTRASDVAAATVYQALRANNPAWYSGYIATEHWAIASSSPELFLRCRDGHITTRPIKGTSRRTGDPDADQRAAAELVTSVKDNAELAMIIDLLRNDLGRVCRYGTVRVTDARALEMHPTVFHLVGTVEGDLRLECDRADLIAATFPGGSITGAPKIRAMAIIDEIEPVARGAYTGSIVHLGVDGSAEMSIVIRTAICERGCVHVNVGGGIVADSTPDGEYAETLDKARAVLAAIIAAERMAPVEAE